MWQRNAVHKVGKPSAFHLELVKFYQWNRCRTGIYLGFALTVQIWPPCKMHALVKCAATSRSRRLICSVARVSTSQVSCCIEKNRAGRELAISLEYISFKIVDPLYSSSIFRCKWQSLELEPFSVKDKINRKLFRKCTLASQVGQTSEGANCVCCDATVANCYTHTQKEKLLRRS